MWVEYYDKLTAYEKGEFRRLGNYLLSHSYLVKEMYDTAKGMITYDEDYRMAKKLLPLLVEYFDIIGWKVVCDDNYGVISLYSQFDNNRLKLGRFTTLFLYCLRLVYEEKREELVDYRSIRTSTVDVVEKMNMLGLNKGSKTTIKERIEAQRALEHHNIIQKLEGKWLAEGNQLIILPAILNIVSNQGITEMAEELEEMRVDGNAEPEDTEAQDEVMEWGEDS